MRVDRCFGFVDLCGFTSFAEQNGDDKVVVVLAAMRTMLREAAARRGVRIVKWLGDGAMLSSTMPEAVVGLTVELTDVMAHTFPALPIRGGLAAGPVIMFEGDDYIGYPVNVAARLCAQASPRELLATEEVARTRPPWIGAESAMSVAVRGLARDVATRKLYLRSPGTDPVLDPVCGLRIRSAHALGGPGGHGYCSEACAGAARERQLAAEPAC